MILATSIVIFLDNRRLIYWSIVKHEAPSCILVAVTYWQNSHSHPTWNVRVQLCFWCIHSDAIAVLVYQSYKCVSYAAAVPSGQNSMTVKVRSQWSGTCLMVYTGFRWLYCYQLLVLWINWSTQYSCQLILTHPYRSQDQTTKHIELIHKLAGTTLIAITNPFAST